MTVFVLRFYYRPPSFLQPIEHQLPYLIRLILFKYIGNSLGLKFYCRKKKEPYIIKVNQTIENNNFNTACENLHHLTSKLFTSKKKKFQEFLIALRMLNRCLQSKYKYKIKNAKLSEHEEYCTKLYFEEWKQASLVLDRYYYFLY